MNIDLILSKIPSQNQLSQIFKNFGFKTCTFLQNSNWEILENDSSEIIVNFSKTLNKKWRCHLEIFIFKNIENEKLVYFATAKQIAQIADCDVICCYYDNDELKGGEIKIVKSIDKEMAYFLKFGKYLRSYNVIKHSP